MSKSSADPKKILLGQLASKGDCLYATAIARQIKKDYPGCRLTWGIGTFARDVIEGNPDVDEIWEFPMANRHEMDYAWKKFATEARRRRRQGDFDRIFLTQINPSNYQNFDGTVRASIFRGYPGQITVPVQPVIRLSEEEVASVARFAARHDLRSFGSVILFECAGASGQTFVTPDFALAVSRIVTSRVPGTAIILSSNVPVRSGDPRIIDGSDVKFRENAELTRYCALVVGCSSGISWLCTSDWARPLPFIQLLKKSTGVFASMYHDARYFGLPTENILEMTDTTPERVAECMVMACCEGFSAARDRFHETIRVQLDLYIEGFMKSTLRSGHPEKVIKSLWNVYKRYGAGPFKEYLVRKMKGARD
jgi:hypothetical protein